MTDQTELDLKPAHKTAKPEDSDIPPGKFPGKEWKEYPDTYTGHVEWHVDWLRFERDEGSDNLAYGDPEITKIVAANFEECARIMEGQLKAIQIVKTMLDEMYSRNPTPQMKALRAAVIEIYCPF